MSIASWVALVANLLLAVLAFALTINEKLIKKHRRRLWTWFVVLVLASTVGTIWQASESASSQKELIATTTGGNSYCYLVPTLAGDRVVQIGYVHQGAYPLYGVQVRIVRFRPDGTDPSIRTIENIYGQDLIQQPGEIAPGYSSIHPVNLQIEGDFAAWNIFFHARNGSWDQLLRLRRVGGKWVSATKVLVRDGNDQREVFVNVNDGYPSPVSWTESR